MIGVDTCAVAGAASASLALALRSIMLKPDMPSWCDAPPGVRLAIVFAAAILAGVALDVLRTGHAGPREAITLSVLGVSSAVLLANLWRQDCSAKRSRDDG